MQRDVTVRLRGRDLEAACEVMQDGIEDIVGGLAFNCIQLAVLGTLEERAEVWVRVGPPAWHPYRDERPNRGDLTAAEARTLRRTAEHVRDSAAESVDDYEKFDPESLRLAYHRQRVEHAERVLAALESPGLQLVPSD